MERLIKVMDKYLSDAKKKVLTLTVCKKWFDMIVSGEKTEEYREIKGYWSNRLFCQERCDLPGCYPCKKGLKERLQRYYKGYTHVLFVNGYRKDSPRIKKKIESVTIGKPKKGMCPDKWLDTEFFIIKFK